MSVPSSPSELPGRCMKREAGTPKPVILGRPSSPKKNLESQWFITMGYLKAIMVYFGV